MKNPIRYLIPALLGGALAAAAHAADTTTTTVVRKIDRPVSAGTVSRDGDPVTIRIEKTDGKESKESVTYLGVETAPVGRTLARQLGLGRDMGLVVTHVAEGSPAATVLQEDDILSKLDDQLLVDSRQFSVLIRSKKAGDEISLTVIRGGKETVVKAKLGQREVSRISGLHFGPEADIRFFDGHDLSALKHLRELPGMAREDVGNALRLLGRERGNWFSMPRVHVYKHKGGKDTTVLDMAQGNLVYSDDEGSVELNAKDGNRELTVKNAKGEVTFKGPINTEEDRKKLPPEVLARLHKIEKIDVDFQPGEDFEQEGAAVEPPTKTKTRQSVDRSAGRSLRGLRAL